jgi:hypothetical protein
MKCKQNLKWNIYFKKLIWKAITHGGQFVLSLSSGSLPSSPRSLSLKTLFPVSSFPSLWPSVSFYFSHAKHFTHSFWTMPPGEMNGKERASPFLSKKSVKIFVRTKSHLACHESWHSCYVKTAASVLISVQFFPHWTQPAFVGKQYAEWIGKDYS